MGSITREIELTLDLDIEYKYTKGRPATPPAYSHGGLPPDPPEIEIVSMKFGTSVIDFDALSEIEKQVIEDEIIEHEESGDGEDFDGDDHDG